MAGDYRAIGRWPPTGADSVVSKPRRRVGMGGARYSQSCTPSFYDSEQQATDARAARNNTFTDNLLDYVGHLERWREQPGLTGVKVRRREPVEGA